MYKGYSDDITWCNNQRCNRMRCRRNPKHIRPTAPTSKLFYFADLEGSVYCIKGERGDLIVER